jgi:nicotinamidase-related amidase
MPAAHRVSLQNFLTGPDLIVCGCETHVCVLQTVLGLLGAGRHVFAIRDALGSRRPESKETAIRRMVGTAHAPTLG